MVQISRYSGDVRADYGFLSLQRKAWRVVSPHHISVWNLRSLGLEVHVHCNNQGQVIDSGNVLVSASEAANEELNFTDWSMYEKQPQSHRSRLHFSKQGTVFLKLCFRPKFALAAKLTDAPRHRCWFVRNDSSCKLYLKKPRQPVSLHHLITCRLKLTSWNLLKCEGK